ncbi:hypothetical protein VOLCADRAFT_106955 [Volvox carteri f. nagariensis]|uniref:Uncharacterized protein n=1 Tax=Volvox carteri f. nagariensis TaxID=3068 RepID=D8UAW3_VOLCA|nr:uncharacterized protein VOLCADRAFT_106955 [Volvox carteri f. nagariensis]EFJ43171.1 hypothetical protein VOLCADRAFT_106955 [Volvox carteri f. nagariensis]|eukprot:XP_002955746.1 hypothetical protein VOLCADRAFT_106955 [Volvox carteri f. nagariensis]
MISLAKKATPMMILRSLALRSPCTQEAEQHFLALLGIHTGCSRFSLISCRTF